MSSLAIYPGTFDPITNGHIDIIKRAQYLFDNVIVAVTNNRQKNPLFMIDERVQMLKDVTQDLKNVKVESFKGLVVDYARGKKAKIIIRGLRMISDFEYEFQMALTNRNLAQDVETIFLMPSENYSYLSSGLLKEAAALGADISSFVPKSVEKKVKERLKK